MKLPSNVQVTHYGAASTKFDPEAKKVTSSPRLLAAYREAFARPHAERVPPGDILARMLGNLPEAKRHATGKAFLEAIIADRMDEPTTEEWDYNVVTAEEEELNTAEILKYIENLEL